MCRMSSQTHPEAKAYGIVSAVLSAEISGCSEPSSVRDPHPQREIPTIAVSPSPTRLLLLVPAPMFVIGDR